MEVRLCRLIRENDSQYMNIKNRVACHIVRGGTVPVPETVTVNQVTGWLNLLRYVESLSLLLGHWVNETPVIAARVRAVRAAMLSPETNNRTLPIRAIPTPIKWR